MKKYTEIPFSEIENIPQLIKDFLNGRLSEFSDDIFELKNFQQRISARENSFKPEQRQLLNKVLSRQMLSLQCSENQGTNLDLILQENTFTVTTGHQLNLFSGPVFFIFKIVQTIKTALYLKEQFPNKNFVPIFWMATEDHDFEEINHFKTQTDCFQIIGKSGGAVGRMRVDASYAVSQFTERFRHTTHGAELIAWFEEAYSQGNSLADAIRILVNYLFGEQGLLILDADDAELKAQMKPYFKAELLSQKLFHSLERKVQFLKNAYGKVQVNPREINVFYLSETRDRIEKSGKNYSIVDRNISFTQDEILQELETYPEKFSPNAILRPVYQEVILPNVAYVGGNAEIMYWLELKDYFAENQLICPILIPRNSMLFLAEKTISKIEKLHLKINDFYRNFASVIREKLLENTSLDELLILKKTEIEAIFSELKIRATETDITFRNLVEAEEIRQLKSYKRMEKRLLRAEKLKQKERLERMERLFLEVHPMGNWQERILNFSVFYADGGWDWLSECYNLLTVEKSQLIIAKI